MGDKAKTMLGEAFPRWATLILLAYCAWSAKRLINDMDTTTHAVRQNTTTLAVHTEQIAQQTKAFGQMDQILRNFETRLVRQEERKQ